QATLSARDALAASVTHDLRSPLGIIRLGVESASRFLDNSHLSDRERHVQVQEALKQVEDTTLRMDAFIQELLDVAVLESGSSLALHRQPTDLVQVLRMAVAARAAAGRAIDLETPTTPVVGQWDRLRLERVIDNLLSNA